MKYLLALLLSVACATTDLAAELRYAAADLRDAVVLIEEDDPELAANLVEVSDAADELAGLAENGTDISNVDGLLKTLDAILVRDDLDPKVGGAALLLKSRLRRLVQ